MVQIAGNFFGRKPQIDLSFLVARARELELAIRAAESHLATLKTDRLAVDTIAAEANVSAELAAALAPPAVLPPTPLTRIRALKHFKARFHGRHGWEEFSGAAGTVNDIPTVLLRELKGRVEVVPPETEIRGVPLEPWMSTTD